MDSQTITTLLSITGAIVIAGLGYLFTKWREREASWRNERLKHYTEFTESLGSLLAGAGTDEERVHYAKSFNNLVLVAPQKVLNALQDFAPATSPSSLSKQKRDDILYYEIRKDLKITPKDDQKTFHFEFQSSGVRKSRK